MVELELAPPPCTTSTFSPQVFAGAHNQQVSVAKGCSVPVLQPPFFKRGGLSPLFAPSTPHSRVQKTAFSAKTATDKDTRHPHAWQLARAVSRASPRPAPSKGLGLSESARARMHLHCVALHDLSCAESCERGREMVHFVLHTRPVFLTHARWRGGGARCLPLAWAEAYISTRQPVCAMTMPPTSCLKEACGVDLLAERGRERCRVSL
jgi:hypothetical protein